MYLIIVGAGDIEMPLIQLVASNGHDIVLIEKDEHVVDTTVADTLDEAGAEQATGVISTPDTDATNVMVILLAVFSKHGYSPDMTDRVALERAKP